MSCLWNFLAACVALLVLIYVGTIVGTLIAVIIIQLKGPMPDQLLALTMALIGGFTVPMCSLPWVLCSVDKPKSVYKLSYSLAIIFDLLVLPLVCGLILTSIPPDSSFRRDFFFAVVYSVPVTFGIMFALSLPLARRAGASARASGVERSQFMRSSIAIVGFTSTVALVASADIGCFLLRAWALNGKEQGDSTKMADAVVLCAVMAIAALVFAWNAFRRYARGIEESAASFRASLICSVPTLGFGLLFVIVSTQDSSWRGTFLVSALVGLCLGAAAGLWAGEVVYPVRQSKPRP